MKEPMERLRRAASASSRVPRFGGRPPSAAPPSAEMIRSTLVAVARDPGGAGERLVGLRRSDLAAVLRVGAEHGLGIALVTSLHAADMPVPIWLETHRFNAIVRRAQIMDTLGIIAPVLTSAEIPWVVLKGPVITRSEHAPQLREFGDLDVLVPGRHLSRVLEVLEDVGIDGLNRNWGAYLRYGVAEFPVLISGTPIDLHWHPIGLGMIRKRFRIAMDELLERRISGSEGDMGFPRLGAEDNVIQVALHAGLSGATRIGWLRDVHELVEGSDLDWDGLVARTRRFGVSSLVGHVLDRCRFVLGTAVPSEVTDQLAPLAALRLRRRLDAGTLSLRHAVDPSFSGFLVAISRAGTMETAGRTRELVWSHMGTRIGRAERWSAYDPEGSLYWQRASGGADGLQRYLQFAAQTA